MLFRIRSSIKMWLRTVVTVCFVIYLCRCLHLYMYLIYIPHETAYVEMNTVDPKGDRSPATHLEKHRLPFYQPWHFYIKVLILIQSYVQSIRDITMSQICKKLWVGTLWPAVVYIRMTMLMLFRLLRRLVCHKSYFLQMTSLEYRL